MPATPQVDVTIDWDVHGEAPFAAADVETLIGFALACEGRDGAWVFALRFVDDDEIARQHEAYLGDPSATDIMTFPYDDEQGGDVLVSVDTASANARAHGWTTEDELRFLILHGLLHVLGWEDHDELDRAAMLERQEVILRSWAAR